jgi:DNA polymerase III epsilon subunit-like protein
MILTFLDTETTGLDLMQHEVIEVAMLQVDVDKNFNYGEISCYEAKIKPLYIKRASSVALKINGYTAGKWRKAHPVAEVLPTVKQWVEESDYLVGQNLIFDYNFINQLFDRENIERPKYPKYYDTKKMAEALVEQGTVKRTSLDYLCENFNIPTVGRAHTALTDVMRTFELYKKLSGTIKPTALSFKKPYDPFKGK